MKKPNILYISGSLGLGHISRDIAIAREIRKLLPESNIEWLAADPPGRRMQLLFEPFPDGCR